MGKDTYSRQPADNCEQGCASKTQRDANNEPKEKVTATISFRIAVFYDGTGNNKLNTYAREAIHEGEPKTEEKRKEYEKKLQELANAYDYLEPPAALYINLEKAKENFKKNRTVYESEKKRPVSYMGADTNVYKMFRDLDKPNEEIKENAGEIEWKVFKKFYIEGMGTTGSEDDDTMGGAFGYGLSGIVGRSNQAKNIVVNFILKKIQEFKISIRRKKSLHLSKIDIVKIDFDFFGFSRGAATARYSCKSFLEDIVEQIKKPSQIDDYYEEEMITSKSVKSKLVEKFPLYADGINYNITSCNQIIKNVGIFDTVASYGIIKTGTQQSNVEELYLKSVSKAAKVFHITASDEFRVNFSLTTVSSAVKIPMSMSNYEISIPGAHCDIGGGYNPDESEDKPINFAVDYEYAEKLAFWFKQKGYVEKILRQIGTSNRFIEISEKPLLQSENGFEIKGSGINAIKIINVNRTDKWDVFINRPKISNTYSRISLNLMKEKFKEEFSFKESEKSDSELDNSLVEINKAIKNNYSTKEIESLAKKIRKEYLHFSGHDWRIMSIKAYTQRWTSESKDEFIPFKRKTHDG